jgi:hypothetical protein
MMNSSEMILSTAEGWKYSSWFVVRSTVMGGIQNIGCQLTEEQFRWPKLTGDRRRCTVHLF